MSDPLPQLFVFITTLVTMVILGGTAGFSPVLYIAHIAAIAKSTRRVAATVAITGGVLAAIIVLIILFQLFHLATLLSFIGTSLHAIIVTIVFNGLTGVALIVGGIWYLRRRPSGIKPNSEKSTHNNVLVGLGFTRTITSVSTVAATYAAGTTLSSVSVGFFDRLLYSAAFLAATIAPFVLIIFFVQKRPKRLNSIVRKIQKHLGRMNYQVITGIGAISVGAVIIIFTTVTALLH